MSNRLSKRQRNPKPRMKGNTPYKYYMDMEQILARRYDYEFDYEESDDDHSSDPVNGDNDR